MLKNCEKYLKGGSKYYLFYNMWIIYLLLFLQLALPAEYYYFQPENKRGSELFFHPINTVLNGSFDILRNGTYSSKNLLDVPYKGSLENIWFNITHPIENVEKFGVNKFVELEIFNPALTPQKGIFSLILLIMYWVMGCFMLKWQNGMIIITIDILNYGHLPPQLFIK